MGKKIEECEANYHPYKEEVIVPYYGKEVLVRCSNCKSFHNREPTYEELQDYRDIFKLEFII